MKARKPNPNSIFTSFILKETLATSVVPDRDNSTVRVRIHGEDMDRLIPEKYFIYAICTREDPPNFRLRFLDTYTMDVEMTKAGTDFSVGKDKDGYRMLMNTNFLERVS